MRHQFPKPVFAADESSTMLSCIHCGAGKKFYISGNSQFVNEIGLVIAAPDCKKRKPKQDMFPAMPTSLPGTRTIPSIDRMSHYDARMLEAYSALKLCYDELVKNGIVCRARDITKRTLESDSYREVVGRIDEKTKSIV